MTLWWSRQRVWVIGNINEHISTNIHPYKRTKGYIGQWYPYSTEWDIFCGDNSYEFSYSRITTILWLLYYYTDTESGGLEVKAGIPELIFTNIHI